MCDFGDERQKSLLNPVLHCSQHGEDTILSYDVRRLPESLLAIV